jgi:hypothetical protein
MVTKRCLILHQPIKNIAIATGTIKRIEPKSGWSAKRKIIVERRKR